VTAHPHSELPGGWTVRRPTLDDVPEILAVVRASDIAATGEPDYTADNVIEILTSPHHDPSRDSWLAVDAAGRVVAWAYVENAAGTERENVDVYVHPEHGRSAQAHLLDLVLDRVAERAGEAGRSQVTARAGAITTETDYIGLLRAAGFEYTKRYARMRIPLRGDETAPPVPAGMCIRTMNADLLGAFYDVFDAGFRDTHGYVAPGYAGFRARIEALPHIHWDEWFLAEVRGAPAGMLESASADALSEGWVRYLAVHPDFQGRGLAKLLLRTAFATYAAKGFTRAGLGVDATHNTGAYRVYEAVGMRPLYEMESFQRTVLAQAVAVRVGRDRSAST
jgi:mycothiol synthase